MKIVEAMNTYNPALNLLREWGYTLSLIMMDGSEDIDDWVAEKPEVTAMASDPLRLLALVCLAENYGNKWTEKGKDKIYDEILEKYS